MLPPRNPERWALKFGSDGKLHWGGLLGALRTNRSVENVNLQRNTKECSRLIEREVEQSSGGPLSSQELSCLRGDLIAFSANAL